MQVSCSTKLLLAAAALLFHIKHVQADGLLLRRCSHTHHLEPPDAIPRCNQLQVIGVSCLYLEH